MAPKAIYLLGFIGQLFFTMRFVLQWFVSEKQKRSVVPTGFWYCSLFGGGLLLLYAILRRDPVFICGQGFGFLVYIRNLHFIKSEKPKEEAEREAELQEQLATVQGK